MDCHATPAMIVALIVVLNPIVIANEVKQSS